MARPNKVPGQKVVDNTRTVAFRIPKEHYQVFENEAALYNKSISRYVYDYMWARLNPAYRFQANEPPDPSRS